MSNDQLSDPLNRSDQDESESDFVGNRQFATALLRSEQALRLVSINMPWLSPLVYCVRLQVDAGVNVAAVTRTGVVFVNPNIFATIPMREATYIIAHELLHIALDTFSRETSFDDPKTVNIAHDYIINDLLREEMQMDPPLGGLNLHGAAEWSLEKIVNWMKANPSEKPRVCWDVIQPSLGIMGAALRDAGLAPKTANAHAENGLASVLQPGCDVIFSSLESQLFPNESSSTLPALERVKNAALQAVALKKASAIAQRSMGNDPGNSECYLQAVRSHCQPPWQVALQKWMEAVVPGPRSYARPSRRGADRTDCVLPGKTREGWTLHIVLDTSGSMADVLPECLGAIADFCEAMNVEEVHIIQCDTTVTVDEWVPADSLESYKIEGFGGSDMSPGMLHLAEDREVTAMIVITDGCINYPSELPQIDVLWVLTESASSFEPPYGTVLQMK